METRREVIPMAELMPVISSALEEKKPVEMTVTGNSMMPLFLDRISVVRLTCPDDLKTGDIVLYKRNDGHFVLHRIVKVHGGLYDIVGDNQFAVDRNVSKEDIIALVDGFSRDGKRWQSSDGLYRVLLPLLKFTKRVVKKIKRTFS